MTDHLDAPQSLGDPAPTFDVALGIRIDVLQRAVDKLYEQLYPQFFRDSTRIADGHHILWNVKEAPRLDFSGGGGNGLAARLAEELSKLPPPEGMLKSAPLTAEKLEPLTSSLDSLTIKLHCSSIDVTIVNNGVHATTTASAVAYVGISTRDGRIKFTPLRVDATTPNADDEYMLNEAIVPTMLTLAGQIFSAIQIPELSAGTFRLSSPAAQIYGGKYLVVYTAVGNHHVPYGIDVPLPTDPEAFIVLSPFLLQSAFSAVTFGKSQSFQTSGMQDLVINEAHWDAYVEFSDIRGSNFGTRFPVTGAVNGRARGWLTSFMGDIGVGFRAQAQPNPKGTVELNVDQYNTIRGRMTGIDPFVVQFTPTGSVFEKVMGYVMSPLTAFATLISPAISRILEGIAFDVWSVPDLPITYGRFRITIHPHDLRLTQNNTHVHITGGVQLL